MRVDRPSEGAAAHGYGGHCSRISVKAIWHATLLVLLARSVLALDPTQPADSYIRTSFTVEDGLPSNVVNTITQTSNGFLWIGTDEGLVRFNGRRFAPVAFRGREVTTQGVVNVLAVSPAGDLWIGTGTGLVRAPRAALDRLEMSPLAAYHLGSEESDNIRCIRFARDGALWIGTNRGLYRRDGARFVSVVPGISVSRLEESSKGNIEIISDQGYIEWDGAKRVEHPGLRERLGTRPREIFHVYPARDGSVWFCTGIGVGHSVAGILRPLSPYGAQGQGAYRAMEDRQGRLWVSMSSGLFRAGEGVMEPAAPGVHTRSMYADRDGNLWVGSNGSGLIRFKDRAIRMFGEKDGLPSDIPISVLTRHDGSLWVGSSCGGISSFDGSRFTAYSKGLSNSCVYALAEDAHNDLWVGTWGGGLFRFRDGTFTQFGPQQGLAGEVVLSIAAARDGSLWLATEHGVSHMENGTFHTYTTADGLSSDRVFSVYQDRGGRIWAGTSRGVDRLEGERFIALRSDRKIFDAPASSLAEDSSGALYTFSAPKGISRVEGDRLRTINADLDLLGMVEFEGRELWFSGGNGIVRVPAEFVRQSGPGYETPIDYEVFGRVDGLNSAQCTMGSPNMAITPDRKLWVATVKGLAQLDLARLSRAKRKPVVFVDEIALGRSRMPAGPKLDLRPGTRHLELHFDAIEFSSPEKIRFQYRLDGVDPFWLDADINRTAVYTSIPVGVHSFHVRACDVNGLWDRTGIVYAIEQQPYFYETNLFRALCGAAITLAVWAIYRRRLRHMVQLLNMQYDERLFERMRIARALHDTLLQSFQASIFHFQAARKQIPNRPAQAIETLDGGLERADRAIDEGRKAIEGLRTAEPAESDLIRTLAALGKELAALPAGETVPKFRVVLEGTPQRLHPILGVEVELIASEAVRNAFRHAKAKQIEAEVRFEKRQFTIRIRDDGRGTDPEFFSGSGKAGHWGIAGMRERARNIGAHFEVWSEQGAGTEIELKIPGSIAYQGAAAGSRFRLFRKAAKNV